MSIATVVTRGFGSFGDIAHVVTQGFDITAVVQVSPCPQTAYSDTTAAANDFYYVNQGQATWDAGASSWDYIGNVYISVFDSYGPTYSDASLNTSVYGHAQSCLLWDGGTKKWDLIGNVYKARWI